MNSQADVPTQCKANDICTTEQRQIEEMQTAQQMIELKSVEAFTDTKIKPPAPRQVRRCSDEYSFEVGV